MNIVIEGAGEVGSHLAKMLSHEANDITVIDEDQERLSKLSQVADVITVCGDPSSIEVLKEAGADKADLFIAVNPHANQSINIVTALLAKKLGARKVTARIKDESYLASENKLMFKDLGIDLMFYPEKIASDEILGLLKHSAAAESMDFARGRLQLSVFKIDEDSPLLEMNVAEFTKAVTETDAEVKFRIIAIARGDETIIPKFDTRFKYQDRLYIISKRDGIDTIIRFVGKERIVIDSVMILGGSTIGEITARQLSSFMSNVKIIDMDRKRCQELSERLPSNVSIVCGDARNSDLLLEESIKDYDAFIAVTGNDEVNILGCVVAKKFGVERAIAKVENIEYVRLAEEMGVDAIVNKKLLTAGRIFKFTLSDKVRFVKYMSGTDAEVFEYTVAPGSRITEAQLKDMDFPRDAIIGGIVRGSESFIAVGDSRVEPYDRVVVFALPSVAKEVDRFFR